ncbi:MAG: serine/threonine-protein kinase [Bacteroidales bacterium]|nr:serine/threonine-protein kinase [Bacteroidales bacterium]
MTNDKSCKIIRELGRGGQGIVYLVDYDGGQYALKWYIIDTKPEFYTNLENNVKQGAPSSNFLWTLAITKRQCGSFGYIMKLRPKEYKELGSFMLAKSRFASVDALLEACLQICSAFQKLHILGLSYQDMNDGNFFINPDTGDVLICDNDNVAPDKMTTGIVGKSGYMAPEIVDKASMPNRYTDYFSLAVILFIMIYLNRPFEGRRVSSCPCLTEEAERKLFGRECVFIMDPTNNSNRPDPSLHINVLRRWPLFPRILRETFIKAFCSEAIKDPTKRIMDKTWQKVLIQVRSQYAYCPSCGKKTFIDPDGTCKCVMCDSTIQKTLILKAGNYKIPIVKGQKVYKTQVQISSNVGLNDAYAEVITNPSGKLGFKNVSNEPWTVTTPTNEIKVIEPGRGFPALEKLKVKLNKDTTALITF